MSALGTPEQGDRTGWGPLYPLRFVGNDFDCGTGWPLVKSAVLNIIGAKGASEDGGQRGEFPALRRLGTQVSRAIHKNIQRQGTKWIAPQFARIYALDAISQFEPRADVDPNKITIKPLSRRARVVIKSRLNAELTGRDDGGEIATEI